MVILQLSFCVDRIVIASEDSPIVFTVLCLFREIIEPVCVDLTFSLYLSDAIKASLHNNGRISRRRAINPHSSLSPPTSHHHQVRLPLYRHFSFLHSSGKTAAAAKKVGKIYYSNDSIGTATTTTGSSQQFITNLCFGKKISSIDFFHRLRVGLSPPPAPGLYHFSRLLFLPTCTST